jgi:hypothetical protein
MTFYGVDGRGTGHRQRYRCLICVSDDRSKVDQARAKYGRYGFKRNDAAAQ